MRIYLDNCSYNRPYDDQSQMRVYLETQAKLHIQELIREGKLELVTSYVLDYENQANRSVQKKKAIAAFMQEYASFYVSTRNEETIAAYAAEIMGDRREGEGCLSCGLCPFGGLPVFHHDGRPAAEI